jgi:hypothetical protein
MGPRVNEKGASFTLELQHISSGELKKALKHFGRNEHLKFKESLP